VQVFDEMAVGWSEEIVVTDNKRGDKGTNEEEMG